MRRLYLQVYLTIVGSLLLVVLTAGLVWHFIASVPPFGQPFEIAGEVVAELVPPAQAPLSVQQQVIDRLARRLGADLALFGRAKEPLAAAGRPLPPPSRGDRTGGWLRTPAGPAVSIELPDGRWLVARLPVRPRPRALVLGLPRGHCARRRVRGASRRTPGHATARAIAARGRVARSRRSYCAREGRRPRRGRTPG